MATDGTPEVPRATPARQRLEHVKSVAVIGAGVSGISAAAHLLQAGLEVVLFERSGSIGGVWKFDPRAPLTPPFPNQTPPAAASQYSLTPDGLTTEETSIYHASPTPCYAGLCNNIDTSVMRTSLQEWPSGTPSSITAAMVSDYIGELAKTQHVVPHIQFWTRVESAVKPQGSVQWHVRTKTFIRDGDSFVFDIRENRFDAVVVATGHYDVPRVPDIPGLATWQARFPGRVAHSKAYRTPDMFKDATVLVIGAGVSAYDIIHAIHSVGGRTYQSSRDPKRADKAKLEGLPDSCERVPGIETFLAEDTGPAWKADSADPVPGRVVLSGGRELTGIHYVVVATGYITTYHFLGDLEQPTLPLDEADEKVIITADAYTVHNLHKDIFYIPDPTLAFIGVPSEASTFSLFDFQAKALAKVFTGQAQLPSREDMAKLHRERKLALKPGKKLHGLGLGDVEYANDILDWINGDLQRAGLPPMTGYDDRWFEGFKRLRESVASIRPDVEQV